MAKIEEQQEAVRAALAEKENLKYFFNQMKSLHMSLFAISTHDTQLNETYARVWSKKAIQKKLNFM